METPCKVCGGAHTTGACTEKPGPDSIGQQIEEGFKALGGGIKEAAYAKVVEYDQRIRAAQEGTPLKAGDTATNLLSDFKRFAGQAWSKNFDMAQYRNEKLGGSETTQSIAEAETTGGAETSEQIDLERANSFILKLAEASNLGDDEAVDAMVKQITILETDNNFPEFFAALDPEQYHQQTKFLDEKSKQRLVAALDRYLKEKNQK